jgi:flagellar P-ring protein precursor FlgI
VRENQLIGYGIVVGLNGSGDSLRNAPMTKQSLEAMLERQGVNVRDGNLNTKNTAAVMVTAALPPFSAAGSKLDVTVSTLGDAKSLLGGTLLVTSLQGADGQTYAVAQGTVQTGSVSAGGASGSSVTKGVPTAGRIAAGGIIEARDRLPDGEHGRAAHDPAQPGLHDLAPHRRRHQRQVPRLRPGPEPDHRRRPPPEGMDMISFITNIENLEVEPDSPAKVVIDEVAGVIVMGDDVRISQVAIAQGNLTISVQETPAVSQPAPFSQGQTKVIPQSTVSVDEEKGKKLITLGGGAVAQEPGRRPQRPGRHAPRHDLDPAGREGRGRAASRHRGDVMSALSAISSWSPGRRARRSQAAKTASPRPRNWPSAARSRTRPRTSRPRSCR